VGAVPLFTDCQVHGNVLTLANGSSIRSQVVHVKLAHV
jgi:hypothetical protein